MTPVEPDPTFEAAAAAIRSGDTAALAVLLERHPDLTRAREPGGRSLLHIATDWPGHFPDVVQSIGLLVNAGADVNVRFIGAHQETPLHWAASTDDVAALEALLEAGAQIDAPGAVIGGGTPLNDATAFGQWQAARALVERGATVSRWDMAALGMTAQLRALLDAEDATDATDAEDAEDAEDAMDAEAGDLNELLWAAGHGGHRDTAQLLVERGANPGWVGWDDLTSAGAAERGGAHDMASWLRSVGH